MIDFLKIRSLPVKPETLLNNELLTFPLSNVASSGELLNRAQIAHYNSLQFVIRGNNSGLKGSLHKYKYDGANWQDFNISDIQEVIQELSETFEFSPATSFINFIEIGVNIILDYDPNRLIDCFVLYRNTPFDKMKTIGKGYGKVAETDNFDIKVYNKSLQYGLQYHLLRFEVKVKRMVFLKQYGINNLTLADLTRPDYFPAFKNMLLERLEGILMFDPEINPDNITDNKERELLNLGMYVEYWQRLDRHKKCRQIKQFEILGNGAIIKSKFAEMIADKCNKLTVCKIDENVHLQQIHHLQESDENVHLQQIHPTIKSEIVAICKVTGLPIYNQDSTDINLKLKGVRWYFKNEPKIYHEKLETLLSAKFKARHCSASPEIFHSEIYHMIRNFKSNPKNNPANNFNRDYAILESKGFKLFPTAELLRPDKLKLLKSEA